MSPPSCSNSLDPATMISQNENKFPVNLNDLESSSVQNSKTPDAFCRLENSRFEYDVDVKFSPDETLLSFINPLKKNFSPPPIGKNPTNDYTNANFQVLDILGDGSFSSVMRVARFDDKRVYALKRLKIPFLKESIRSSKLEEVRTWYDVSNTAHRNIVRLFFAWEQSGVVSMLSEICVGGTLDCYLRDHCLAYLPISEVCAITSDIACGLSHIHSLGIAHLDLKPANILRTAQGLCKITDFGISFKLAVTSPSTTTSSTPLSPLAATDSDYNIENSNFQHHSFFPQNDLENLPCSRKQLFANTLPKCSEFENEDSFISKSSQLKSTFPSPSNVSSIFSRSVTTSSKPTLDQSSVPPNKEKLNSSKKKNVQHGKNSKIKIVPTSKTQRCFLDDERDGDNIYLAPESLAGELTLKTDVFALGLIILEIISNAELPDRGAPYERLRRGDISDFIPHISPAITPTLPALVRSCLATVAALRLSMDEILEIPCISSALVTQRALPDYDDPTDSLNLLSSRIKNSPGLKVPFASDNNNISPHATFNDENVSFNRPPQPFYFEKTPAANVTPLAKSNYSSFPGRSPSKNKISSSSKKYFISPSSVHNNNDNNYSLVDKMDILKTKTGVDANAHANKSNKNTNDYSHQMCRTPNSSTNRSRNKNPLLSTRASNLPVSKKDFEIAAEEKSHELSRVSSLRDALIETEFSYDYQNNTSPSLTQTEFKVQEKNSFVRESIPATPTRREFSYISQSGFMETPGETSYDTKETCNSIFSNLSSGESENDTSPLASRATLATTTRKTSPCAKINFRVSPPRKFSKNDAFSLASNEFLSSDPATPVTASRFKKIYEKDVNGNCENSIESFGKNLAFALPIDTNENDANEIDLDQIGLNSCSDQNNNVESDYRLVDFNETSEQGDVSPISASLVQRKNNFSSKKSSSNLIIPSSTNGTNKDLFVNAIDNLGVNNFYSQPIKIHSRNQQQRQKEDDDEEEEEQEILFSSNNEKILCSSDKKDFLTSPTSDRSFFSSQDGSKANDIQNFEKSVIKSPGEGYRAGQIRRTTSFDRKVKEKEINS